MPSIFGIFFTIFTHTHPDSLESSHILLDQGWFLIYTKPGPPRSSSDVEFKAIPEVQGRNVVEVVLSVMTDSRRELSVFDATEKPLSEPCRFPTFTIASLRAEFSAWRRTISSFNAPISLQLLSLAVFLPKVCGFDRSPSSPVSQIMLVTS